MLHYRREPTLEDLKWSLSQARDAIVELLPEDIRRLVEARYTCTTREASRAHLQHIVKAVIEASPRVQGLNPVWQGERAWCLLCRGGTSGPYQEGFAVPEGLQRHLLGESNAQPCLIMKQVVSLLSEYWDGRFLAQEEDAYRQAQARLEERRRSELVLKPGFGASPELFDEGTWKQHRTAEQLEKAEGRLTDLGFRRLQVGNVVTYMSEHADYVVYADPREVGSIQFRVYATPLPKRDTTRPKKQAWFSLPDAWKHDLPAKYSAKLSGAIAPWKRKHEGAT